MIILAYTLLMLCFLPGFHLFSYSLLPNPQQSNSISHNSHVGSPYPSNQGLRATPNATDDPLRVPDSKPAYTNVQPTFPNQRPNKTPGNTPTSSYYSQYNPTVLYLNPPYAEQGPNYSPTPYGSQPSEPPKSGFWDWFSFITWPKTWLFGSSGNPPAPGSQYAVFHAPNRPYAYNQPPYHHAYSNPLPASPTSAGSLPSVPQAPLKHPQGLYQVPAPNSKFPFVPIAAKYPTNFPAQPQHQLNGYNRNTNQPTPHYPASKPQPVYPSTNPVYTSTSKPSYSTPKLTVPLSPSAADDSTAPKNTYDSPQQAYSIYLVPAKPVYSPPSTSYDYPAPQAPQFPTTFRYPPYGMPNAPAQPYYQNSVPVYGQYGYHQRNPFFNSPQAPESAYPRYPATVKPDCCTTPKQPLVNAETVNAAVVVVPQEDAVINATSSTTIASTTATETTNVTVSDAPVESTTTPSASVPIPQARHLFSGKSGSKGWVGLSSV